MTVVSISSEGVLVLGRMVSGRTAVGASRDPRQVGGGGREGGLKSALGSGGGGAGDTGLQSPYVNMCRRLWPWRAGEKPGALYYIMSDRRGSVHTAGPITS